MTRSIPYLRGESTPRRTRTLDSDVYARHTFPKVGRRRRLPRAEPPEPASLPRLPRPEYSEALRVLCRKGKDNRLPYNYDMRHELRCRKCASIGMLALRLSYMKGRAGQHYYVCTKPGCGEIHWPAQPLVDKTQLREIEAQRARDLARNVQQSNVEDAHREAGMRTWVHSMFPGLDDHPEAASAPSTRSQRSDGNAEAGPSSQHSCRVNADQRARDEEVARTLQALYDEEDEVLPELGATHAAPAEVDSAHVEPTLPEIDALCANDEIIARQMQDDLDAQGGRLRQKRMAEDAVPAHSGNAAKKPRPLVEVVRDLAVLAESLAGSQEEGAAPSERKEEVQVLGPRSRRRTARAQESSQDMPAANKLNRSARVQTSSFVADTPREGPSGHHPPQTGASGPATSEADATQPPQSSSSMRSGTNGRSTRPSPREQMSSSPSSVDSPTPAERKRKVKLRPFPMSPPRVKLVPSTDKATTRHRKDPQVVPVPPPDRAPARVRSASVISISSDDTSSDESVISLSSDSRAASVPPPTQPRNVFVMPDTGVVVIPDSDDSDDDLRRIASDGDTPSATPRVSKASAKGRRSTDDTHDHDVKERSQAASGHAKEVSGDQSDPASNTSNKENLDSTGADQSLASAARPGRRQLVSFAEIAREEASDVLTDLDDLFAEGIEDDEPFVPTQLESRSSGDEDAQPASIVAGNDPEPFGDPMRHETWPSLIKNPNPATQWLVTLLIKWHTKEPLSTKLITLDRLTYNFVPSEYFPFSRALASTGAEHFETWNTAYARWEFHSAHEPIHVSAHDKHTLIIRLPGVGLFPEFPWALMRAMGPCTTIAHYPTSASMEAKGKARARD